MGKELTDAEAAEAFALMDKDGSGEIDFDEAFAWWENQDPEAQAAQTGLKLTEANVAEQSACYAQDDEQHITDCAESDR